MDLMHALKEAKTLIVAKRIDEAENLLTDALDVLRNDPPTEMNQDQRLLLEAELQEGLADIKIFEKNDQASLSHLIAATTQLETLSKTTTIQPDAILLRVYKKMSQAFDRLGQQFESEKYMRSAGRVKENQVREELKTKFTEAGWKISFNVKAIKTEASPVDVIIEKGGLMKKKIAIWFAMDESEVDTISYLTKGYQKFTKSRYIFLLMGQATIPSLSGVKIVNTIDQISLS